MARREQPHVARRAAVADDVERAGNAAGCLPAYLGTAANLLRRVAGIPAPDGALQGQHRVPRAGSVSA